MGTIIVVPASLAAEGFWPQASAEDLPVTVRPCSLATYSSLSSRFRNKATSESGYHFSSFSLELKSGLMPGPGPRALPGDSEVTVTVTEMPPSRAVDLAPKML